MTRNFTLKYAEDNCKFSVPFSVNFRDFPRLGKGVRKLGFEINYLAILVCGVAAMVVGFLWYGPLFGKPWMKEMGWDPNDTVRIEAMKKGSSKAYPQIFIGALLMAYVFAHTLLAFEKAMGMGPNTIATGLVGAVWTWIGFIVPVMYGKVLWEGKSMKLFFLDAFYYLANLAVYAIILNSSK